MCVRVGGIGVEDIALASVRVNIMDYRGKESCLRFGGGIQELVGG